MQIESWIEWNDDNDGNSRSASNRKSCDESEIELKGKGCGIVNDLKIICKYTMKYWFGWWHGGGGNK